MPSPYSPVGYTSEIGPATAGFPGLNSIPNNFREWYSWSVIASVVGAAGLICHVPTIDVNRTDIRVETYGLWNGKQRSIRLQAKATSDLGTATSKGVDYVTHSFTREYYDSLREPSTNPIFLVLVALPPLTSPWTRVRSSIHALHAAAWWAEVTDPSTGNANQTVRVPAVQRLDVDGLQQMLSLA